MSIFGAREPQPGETPDSALDSGDGEGAATEVKKTLDPEAFERATKAVEDIRRAQEELKAARIESAAVAEAIVEDARGILRPGDQILTQVDPGKTTVYEPHEVQIRVPIPKEDVVLYPDRDAKAMSTFHTGTSSGAFVGAGGQSIDVTRHIYYSTYEAVDPNDKGAVETALSDSERSREHPSSSWSIQDPEDPTMRLLIGGFGREFSIVKLDPSSGRERSVRISTTGGEENMVVIKGLEEAEDIGNPFKIAMRTLNFARGATLKPVQAAAVPTAPEPTPQSATPSPTTPVV